MKSKSVALIALLLSILLSCSLDKIVELPLTIQNDYSPFGVWFVEIGPTPDSWKSSYSNLKVSKFPEGLTDMEYGYIETNIYQFVYQNY